MQLISHTYDNSVKVFNFSTLTFSIGVILRYFCMMNNSLGVTLGSQSEIIIDMQSANKRRRQISKPEPSVHVHVNSELISLGDKKPSPSLAPGWPGSQVTTLSRILDGDQETREDNTCFS